MEKIPNDTSLNSTEQVAGNLANQSPVYICYSNIVASAEEIRSPVIGKNNAHWCIAYMATITYGAIIVPILTRFYA